MTVTLLRILKHGVPTAVFLAVIGYVMAEAATIWMGSQPRPEARASADAPAFEAEPTVGFDPEAVRDLRYQMPLRMAAWGVGIVVAIELVLALIRSRRPEPAPLLRPPAEADVEALLNQLLQQSEAAKAACPPSPAAQNTPAPR